MIFDSLSRPFYSAAHNSGSHPMDLAPELWLLFPCALKNKPIISRPDMMKLGFFESLDPVMHNSNTAHSKNAGNGTCWWETSILDRRHRECGDCRRIILEKNLKCKRLSSQRSRMIASKPRCEYGDWVWHGLSYPSLWGLDGKHELTEGFALHFGIVCNTCVPEPIIYEQVIRRQ